MNAYTAELKITKSSRSGSGFGASSTAETVAKVKVTAASLDELRDKVTAHVALVE